MCTQTKLVTINLIESRAWTTREYDLGSQDPQTSNTKGNITHNPNKAFIFKPIKCIRKSSGIDMIKEKSLCHTTNNSQAMHTIQNCNPIQAEHVPLPIVLDW